MSMAGSKNLTALNLTSFHIMTTDLTTQKPHISSMKERNRQLPVEILTQIISLATRMHEQDEFYGQPSSIPFTEPSRLLSEPHLSPSARHEEKSSFRDRLSFVRVCKFWHDVGVRFLWSNLTIKLLPDLRVCAQVIETLEQKSNYGSFVRRVQLNAVWAELMSDEVDNSTSYAIVNKVQEAIHSRLYPRLNRLQVLVAPQVFATGQQMLCSCYQEDSALPFYSTIITAMTTVGKAFLDIDLDNATIPDPDSPTTKSRDSPTTILFPQLISLRVRSCDELEILEDIEQHWRAPALQTLSLHFEYIEMWHILVNWAKETLTTLHIYTDSLPDTEPIHLPKLKTLVIQDCMRFDWAELMDAPNVETLIFGDKVDFFQNGGFFAQAFAGMLTNYPLCSKVSYYTPKSIPLAE
ncbi:13209_t:CDS:2, partial [Acaulospora colombiana]